MKTLTCAYELKFNNESLNDTILSLKKKREKFFKVGSSLFEPNNFFGFVLTIEKRFWLIYYGQPNSNFHCETDRIPTKLKSLISNLEIPVVEFENPEGEKKAIVKKSLSGLVQFFKKTTKTKMTQEIHPVCGDNNLAVDCWFAAIHKKEKPALPWLNQAALRALLSEVTLLIEEQVNLKVSAILANPNRLEQNQKVFVDQEGSVLKRNESQNFASGLFTKLKVDLEDRISKGEARLTQFESNFNLNEENLEERLNRLESNFNLNEENLEERLNQVQYNFDLNSKARLNRLEHSLKRQMTTDFHALSSKIDKIDSWLDYFDEFRNTEFETLVSSYYSFVTKDYTHLISEFNELANIVNKLSDSFKQMHQEFKFLQSWTTGLSWRFLQFAQSAGWRGSPSRNPTGTRSSTVDESHRLISY